MEIWNAIVNFIVASVLMGTTLMYGTLGEILTEKSGNLNLGVEGLIYMGGAAGLIAPYLYEQAAGEGASPIIGLVLAILAGFLAAAWSSVPTWITCSPPSSFPISSPTSPSSASCSSPTTS